MHPSVIESRKITCKYCPHKCLPYLTKQLDLADPSAECPVDWKSAWKSIPANGKTYNYVVPIVKNTATWKELHERALEKNDLDDSMWLTEFSTRIPQVNCKCQHDWQKWISNNPPIWNDYFAWTVAAHNAVNIRINKPILTNEEALKIWRH